MGKLLAFLSVIAFLINTGLALAVSPTLNPINIQITPPSQGVPPTTPVGTVITNALTIVFVVAALLVLFMLIIGAFQWITSGGDKENVGHARARITHALIGLAILALAFLIVKVVGQIVNINILDLKSLPSLGQQCSSGQTFDPVTGQCK